MGNIKELIEYKEYKLDVILFNELRLKINFAIREKLEVLIDSLYNELRTDLRMAIQLN